ncbi:MAG TPA: effector-associated domain EAD1-containing protein [Chloroflexia bacterium]
MEVDVNSSLKLNLNGVQEEALRDALLDAFPTHDDLRLMVRYKLNKHLDAISVRSNLSYIASDLIWRAEAEQWTSDLVLAGRAANPGNEKLLRFAQNIGLAPEAPPLSKLEMVIKTENGVFHDPGVWARRLSEIEAQVCRIEIPLLNGRMIYGTGFLLGPGVVMTNYHVMEAVIAGTTGIADTNGNRARPQDAILRFDYIRLADGRTVNPGKEYHLATDNWLVDYSPYSDADFKSHSGEVPRTDQLDYALLRLEGEPGNEGLGGAPDAPVRGWVEAADRAYNFRPNAALAIMQHPQGDPVSLAFETDAIVGVNSNHTRVTYKTNTQGGSSGSPCFNINWELVALHHSGDPNFDPRNPTEKPRYNQGIPFNAILDLLERRGVLSEISLRVLNGKTIRKTIEKNNPTGQRVVEQVGVGLPNIERVWSTRQAYNEPGEAKTGKSSMAGRKRSIRTLLIYGGAIGAFILLIVFVARGPGSGPIPPASAVAATSIAALPASTGTQPPSTLSSEAASPTEATPVMPAIIVPADTQSPATAAPVGVNPGEQTVVLDFVEHAGSAIWYRDIADALELSKPLPPGDTSGCNTGFSPLERTVDYLRFELNTDPDETNDRVFNKGAVLPNHRQATNVTDPYLLMVPTKQKLNTIIGAVYEKHSVEASDHFSSQLSFRDTENSMGDVEVRLQYYAVKRQKDGTDATETKEGVPLKRRCVSYSETTEGPIDFNVDDTEFSGLVGKDIQFELVMLTNGVSDDDYLIWLRPRIERPINK